MHRGNPLFTSTLRAKVVLSFRHMTKIPKVILTAEQRAAFAKLGSVGGKKRAKELSPKRRKAIAKKASKVAAKKRTERAAAKKKGGSHGS